MKYRQIVEHVPIPFCGVALAVAALGPMLDPRAAWAYPLCCALSCAMLALFIARAQVAVACLAVAYVLVRYLMFLLA